MGKAKEHGADLAHNPMDTPEVRPGEPKQSNRQGDRPYHGGDQPRFGRRPAVGSAIGEFLISHVVQRRVGTAQDLANHHANKGQSRRALRPFAVLFEHDRKGGEFHIHGAIDNCLSELAIDVRPTKERVGEWQGQTM